MISLLKAACLIDKSAHRSSSKDLSCGLVRIPDSGTELMYAQCGKELCKILCTIATMLVIPLTESSCDKGTELDFGNVSCKERYLISLDLGEVDVRYQSVEDLRSELGNSTQRLEVELGHDVLDIVLAGSDLGTEILVKDSRCSAERRSLECLFCHAFKLGIDRSLERLVVKSIRCQDFVRELCFEGARLSKNLLRSTDTISDQTLLCS